MGSSPDYERYAQAVPYSDEFVALPKLLTQNVSKRGGVYLELGAGDGQKLHQLLSSGLLASYRTVVATDLSSTRVQRIAQRLPGVKTFAANAQDDVVEPGSVDFVFSDQVIEHVPSDAAMAKAIRAALRPGGLAVVGSVLKLPGAWYFYRNNGQWRLDPTHVREYASLDEFGAIFSSNGLRVLELDTDGVGYPVAEILARVAAAADRSNANRYQTFYADFPWARRLTWKIPVPRYYLCYALLERPEES